MEKSSLGPKVSHLLTHAVEEVFVRESLEKKLLSGSKLRIKLGFDPTSPNIHLGRAIILHKLKEFQDLGHKVIFIVGDFTARIGDPSDKLEKRPMLHVAEIKKNIKKYRAQVGKILDLKKTEFRFNGQWLSKLRFEEIVLLAESFTVQQLSHRRNFSERIEKGQEISLREFLYPLMQGYDSVVVKADVEIGGFDQLFNLKAGRIIQKKYGQKEQDILTCTMLPGTDGRKMSSSWGNIISLLDTPNDMYGKIMSLRDDLIPIYFSLCARVSEEEVSRIKKDIASGINPKELKMELARKIVALYHGEKKSVASEKNFTDVFKNKKAPEDILNVKVSRGSILGDICIKEKIVSSKSEWRRLISQGAVVAISGEKIIDQNFSPTKNETFRIGKKRFINVELI